MKIVKNIDEYILSSPPEVQKKLSAVRKIVKRIIPQAEEAIKYSMPTFVLNGNLLHFAAFKKHLGLYPAPNAIIKFKKELAKYLTSKGAIQFPLDEPLPINLIKKIIKFRVEENNLSFSKKVYEVVCKIPEGKVLTYKQVAEKAGNPLAFRAVGNILNKNYDKKIPCHRVIKTNGEIGGYNRGPQLKKKILLKEGLKIAK
jgi:O-6-methylguanine DNA methyltransferase